MNTSIRTCIRTCMICANNLSPRQLKFCSKDCNNVHSNQRFQNYKSQQARGIKRRLEFIRIKGSKCLRCSYSKNYAALVFHHRLPDEKLFEIDARSCANRSLESLLLEIAKCDLLCANCHAEKHFPHCTLTELVAVAGLEPD